MGHLRMPEVAISDRSKKVWKPREALDQGYTFSLNRWHAIKYISPELVEPGEFVDPWKVFPVKVMRKVDYGIAHGIECKVLQFNLGGVPVGALMQLFIENPQRDIGYYAVRYPRE